MDDRQVRWGLSSGASVLALAGFFWFGISFGVITSRLGWWAWGISTASQAAITVWLFWAAMKLRSRSGFTRADLRRGSVQQRAQTRRILKVFGWTAAGQGALIGTAAWLCAQNGRNDLLWPLIGLITSLHFAPLAHVFHVRAYYVTAVVGVLVSVAAFAGLDTVPRLAAFGGGMAAVMWLSAWYVLRNANGIAARAAQEKWAA